MGRKLIDDGSAPGHFADFAREVRDLGRQRFVEQYGDAFLLLHAADLSGKAPGDTSLPASKGNTAATTFHVFPVRKSERNERPYIAVGRDDENDLVIQDSTISRVHAAILSLGDGRYAIRDLGSANGTSVRDEPVAGESDAEPTPLDTRASVRFGSVTLKFLKAPEFLDFATAFVGHVSD